MTNSSFNIRLFYCRALYTLGSLAISVCIEEHQSLSPNFYSVLRTDKYLCNLIKSNHPAANTTFLKIISLRFSWDCRTGAVFSGFSWRVHIARWTAYCSMNAVTENNCIYLSYTSQFTLDKNHLKKKNTNQHSTGLTQLTIWYRFRSKKAS